MLIYILDFTVRAEDGCENYWSSVKTDADRFISPSYILKDCYPITGIKPWKLLSSLGAVSGG